MDVMMDQVRPTSLSSGLKFLQAVSAAKGKKSGRDNGKGSNIFHEVAVKGSINRK